MYSALCTGGDSIVFVCYRLSVGLPQRESSVFSSALDICSSGRYVVFEVLFSLEAIIEVWSHTHKILLNSLAKSLFLLIIYIFLSLREAKALYSCEAEHSHELSFPQGALFSNGKKTTRTFHFPRKSLVPFTPAINMCFFASRYRSHFNAKFKWVISVLGPHL